MLLLWGEVVQYGFVSVPIHYLNNNGIEFKQHSQNHSPAILLKKQCHAAVPPNRPKLLRGSALRFSHLRLPTRQLTLLSPCRQHSHFTHAPRTHICQAFCRALFGQIRVHTHCQLRANRGRLGLYRLPYDNRSFVGGRRAQQHLFRFLLAKPSIRKPKLMQIVPFGSNSLRCLPGNPGKGLHRCGHKQRNIRGRVAVQTKLDLPQPPL